jgi:tetratricopeptide (TPR) repeat protein
MPGIFYHNEIDVLSLSALFSWLAAILEDPSDERFTDPGDLLSVGRVLEILERDRLADEVYSSDRLQQLPDTDRQKSLLLRAKLQKRQGNLEEASTLWQEAALAGSLEAMIELTKYFEHQMRDYEAALRFTEQALGVSSDNSLTTSLLHRKSRLEAKAQKSILKSQS